MFPQYEETDYFRNHISHHIFIFQHFKDHTLSSSFFACSGLFATHHMQFTILLFCILFKCVFPFSWQPECHVHFCEHSWWTCTFYFYFFIEFHSIFFLKQIYSALPGKLFTVINYLPSETILLFFITKWESVAAWKGGKTHLTIFYNHSGNVKYMQVEVSEIKHAKLLKSSLKHILLAKMCTPMICTHTHAHNNNTHTFI